MKKYQAVIFDLDGTLLNTLEDLADSTNYALRQMNYPERTIDEVRRFVGNGACSSDGNFRGRYIKSTRDIQGTLFKEYVE